VFPHTSYAGLQNSAPIVQQAVMQSAPAALRSLGPQIGAHPDDTNRQAAEAAIDAFAQQSASLQSLCQGGFSLADSLRASEILEQQAQLIKTTCVAPDGSCDINMLDRIHLQKLRQAISPKDKDLTKTGTPASLIPDIIEDISCKLETHAHKQKLRQLANSMSMRLMCIRGAWVDIPLNGLFSDVSDTASSVDRHMDGVTSVPTKSTVNHSIDNNTTFTRWLQTMMMLNATFEPLERIKPGWESIMSLIDQCVQNRWTFSEVRQLAFAALTDHKRAMRAWARTRNTLEEPPKVGDRGDLVLSLLRDEIQPLALHRKIDATDPLHTGRCREIPPSFGPQSTSTSAHAAALYNHQMSQQAAGHLHHQQVADRRNNRRGNQQHIQHPPLPPPPPPPVNQPVFATSILPVALDTAQQLLPPHLWCRSMVDPSVNCPRAMCASLCRFNHTLPAWQKNGQLLNSALSSVGIKPPS